MKEDKENLDGQEEQDFFDKTKERVKENLKKDKRFFGKPANAIKDSASYKAVQTGRKAVLRTKKLTKQTMNFLMKLLALLKSPITWILLAIVIVLIFLWGVFISFGKDQFEQDCGDMAAPSFTTDSVEKKEDRAKNVMGYLISNGMDKEQSSYIASYIMNQSEADPLYNAGSLSGASNDSLINGSPRNIGLTGTMNSRDLAEFAKKNDTNWQDSSTQLRFLTETLNKSNADLKKAGFTNKPSVDNLAKGLGIDISNKDKISKDAKKLEKSYKDEGEHCKAIGDGTEKNHWAPLSDGPGGDTSLNKSSAADLAWDYSWDFQNYMDNSIKPNGGGCGNEISCLSTTPEKLQKVVDEVYATDPDPIYGGTKYTKDCGRNVALAMKGSGTDPDYPWGPVTTQEAYMQGDSRYEKIDCRDSREAGDILIYGPPGAASHTSLYVGVRDDEGAGSHAGEEFIVEASLNDYEPEKKPFDADSCDYDSWTSRSIRWYRFKG